MQDIVERFQATRGALHHAQRDDWGEWIEVWAEGDPAFSLLDTEEANETGGVSAETLEAHGWPTQDGTALLDYVPVLDVVARLDDGSAEDLFAGGFPDPVPSLLAALPSAAHLVGELLGVSWAQGEDWICASVDSTPAEDGPSVRFSLMVRRLEDGAAVGISGTPERAELAAMFNVSPDALAQASIESRWVSREWD